MRYAGQSFCVVNIGIGHGASCSGALWQVAVGPRQGLGRCANHGLFAAFVKKCCGSNLKVTQDQSLADEPPLYSSKVLGEQQISFGGVSVVCNGVRVCSLDKSIRNQAIKSRLFISSQILDRCRAPSRHDIAQDSQFFDGNGEGFYHLTAPR